MAAAKATLHAIRTLKEGKLEVRSLQEYHEMIAKETLKFQEPERIKTTGGNGQDKAGVAG